IDDALRQGAPLLHPEWEEYAHFPDIDRNNNVACRAVIQKGDVDKAFAEADLVVEDVFETQVVHQGYIEPRAGIATVDAGGRIIISASTQNPFNIRATLAKILQLPMNKVRVKATTIGGGFGGKLDCGVEHFTALLAQRTGRPVKLVWSREEEMLAATPRQAARITIKTAVRSDGTITARKASCMLDTGAYAGDGPAIACVSTLMLAGPYRIPNLFLEGVAVYTNKTNMGAYRGPSGPQCCFAVESQMDEIAEKLGRDPLDLRLQNIVHDGDIGPTGQVLKNVGLEEALLRTAEEIGWRRMAPVQPNRGKGIACSWWTTTYGSAAAFVKLNEDGTITLITGATEIGTGAVTAGIAQILAQEMGVSMSDVALVTADTDATPYDFGAQGSRTVFNVGNAVLLAAADCRRQILVAAAERLETSPDRLEIANKRVTHRDDPARHCSLAELAQASLWNGGAIIGRGSFAAPATPYDPSTTPFGHIYPTFNSPTFYAHAAEVEVEPATGEVRIVKYVATHDVGFAINPQYAEGQLQGGAAQGLGQALSEEIVYKSGLVQNPNLTDYKLPTIMDLPDIRAILVEAGSELGPYGAKGVGEPSVIPPGAVVANAIRRATGTRVRTLPITAERLFWAGGEV
ncbi:MAG: xanthine dehydrogenase family protein molybdopterin-binding subunit, partial [Chloroflexota bacterium]